MAKKQITGVWDAKKTKQLSQNYDLIMDRTWYAIAGSHASQGSLDIFWEYNEWLLEKRGTEFQNHTITRAVGQQNIKDFGIWKGFVNQQGFFTLQPTKKILGMQITLPIKMVTQWLSFPQNDSHDEVWTYYVNMMGKQIFIMFALTPHLSDQNYNRELHRLQSENNIDLHATPFYKIQWPADYKLGSTGDQINPKP